MARASAGCLTSAGSTTLPLISIYASGTVTPKIREIGIFNTTTTAVAVKLVRLTSIGTRGATLTTGEHDPDAPVACLAYNTHTVTPSLGDDLGYRTVLGAAAGSGVIWTFGGDGLRMEPANTNGIGVIVENGTGQICQAYIVWDE